MESGKCQFDPSHEGELRGRTLSQDEHFMVSIIFSDRSWSEVLKVDMGH